MNSALDPLPAEAGQGISLCICTYRRSDGLARLLRAIAVLERPPGHLFELVVVDNDPAGSARAVFEDWAVRHDLVARYVVETQPGVGHARNRAIREARLPWIAFLDDDEWPESTWLVALWATQSATGADGVFGPVLAVLEAPVPDPILASGVFERRRLRTGTWLGWSDCATGNVLLRRQWFERAGGFAAAFAVSGGEDSEFFLRCIKLGARFVWCDEAVAHEAIPPARATRANLLNRAFNEGRNYARVCATHGGAGQFVLLALRGFAAACVLVPLVAFARLSRRPQAICYESRLQAAFGKIGAAWMPVSQRYGHDGPDQKQ